MYASVAAWLLAGVVAAQPLTVEVTRTRDVLAVDFALVADLPEAFEAALPSGAVVRVVYPMQLRSDRRLWWDRRLWRGKVTSAAVFDPMTGRYRCELVLDEIVVATQECERVEDARQWLVNPPSVRLSLEGADKPERLRIRVKAIFSSSTTWLIFPSVEGTGWVEVPLVQPATDGSHPQAPEATMPEAEAAGDEAPESLGNDHG
jgi:hypothetical protein